MAVLVCLLSGRKQLKPLTFCFIAAICSSISVIFGSHYAFCFLKVCLYSWWLTKAEADNSGKRLAVGGITSREKEPVRTFSSAPIVKRYDVFTLETADGICVILSGFLNKSLTSGNDFPEDVFKHFVFGFPPNWELYAVNCFESHFSTTAVSENIADPNKSASPLIKREVGTRSDSCSLSKEKPLGSKEDTNQHLGCKSDGIISSNRDSKIPASLKKTKRKLHFNTPETPVTRQMKGQKGIISPECLSYGRSRSGRLLVPTLEFWRNQLPVYNANRRLTGIQEGHNPSGSCTGSPSKPHTKPKSQAHAMVCRSRTKQ